MDQSAIPDDYDGLRELCTAQQAKLGQLQEFVQSLLEQIRLSRHQHFGARSEALRIISSAIVLLEQTPRRIYAG